MKRQIIIFLLQILGIINFLQAKPRQELDWLFVYYMPYDNNLSEFGNEIIAMVQEGTSANIGAVIQADYADRNGIRRYSMVNKEISVENIASENSVEMNVFDAYLSWIVHNFTARHYAVIFLDHGGKLDEVGLDEFPVKKFFKIDSLAKSLKKFNLQIKQKPELLFLQVCTKGSIEALYEFKDCAAYTMYSQTLVGAPNYYYTKMLSSLSRQPDITGNQLAKLIAENEAPHMYESYTCINNKALDKFAGCFSRFIHSFKEDSIYINADSLYVHYYLNEEYWDMSSVWKATSLTNRQIRLTKKLLDLLHTKLITLNHVNPESKYRQAYSGLSVFSPIFNTLYNYRHLEYFKKFAYGPKVFVYQR